MSRQPDAVIVAPWLALGLTEVMIARSTMAPPSLQEVLLEMVGLVVLGASQARFAPEGPWRSPLVPCVVSVGYTTALLSLDSGMALFVTWVGVAALSALIVRTLHRRLRPGLGLGLALAVLGAVWTRTVVLHRGSLEGTALSSPWTAPWSELLSGVAGGPVAPRASGREAAPPILLLTVDTLRADAGVRMAVTRKVGASGAIWPRARASSSWTVPSLATVLTGVAPPDHGAGVSASGGIQPIRDDVPTLPEVLSERGYTTAAFVTNSWLASGLGFDRGFDAWHHADQRSSHRLLLAGFPKGPLPHQADAVVDAALRWIKSAPDRGVFVWVHLVDPHLPYLHAEEPRTQQVTDERLRSGLRLTEEFVRDVRAAYQHEVDVADRALLRLVEAVEERGWLRDGIMMLTADHGEELWDHGSTGHGHTHHAEVIDVPLAMNLRRERGASEGLPTLSDVPTTIMAALGMSFGDGHDLRTPVEPTRVVTSQGNAFFWQGGSATDGMLTAIRHKPGAPPECYPWVDVAETQVVACEDGPVTSGLEALRAIEARASSVELDTRALEALGYVE